ncbi:MAG: PHP domain-containing protein [Candidatus Buchananbacteria bacterium]
MKIKASLHLHAKEDIRDCKLIDYTIKDLIDRAAVLNFKVLAITCHEKMVCNSEMVAYAKSRGILLIPGVEIRLNRKDLLILNCDVTAEQITDFALLDKWRQKHPESFIIVPHPNHGMMVSLGLNKLRRHRDLFDAVEHSWFYSKQFDPNRKVSRICVALNKPFVATSDLHQLKYLDLDYAVLELADLTPSAVFAAIREGKFQNVSQPKSILELAIFYIWMSTKNFIALFTPDE